MIDACGCRGQMSDCEVLIGTESPFWFSASCNFILWQTMLEDEKGKNNPTPFSGAGGAISHITWKLPGMVWVVSHGHLGFQCMRCREDVLPLANTCSTVAKSH